MGFTSKLMLLVYPFFFSNFSEKELVTTFVTMPRCVPTAHDSSRFRSALSAGKMRTTYMHCCRECCNMSVGTLVL